MSEATRAASSAEAGEIDTSAVLSAAVSFSPSPTIRTDAPSACNAATRAAYLERHYPAYWLRVPLDRKIADAEMIRAADAAGTGFSSRVVTHAFEEVTEITVLAADHPRLLSTIAGACFVAGANIVDAQIDTTTDGFALDTIFISRELPGDEDEIRRGERVCRLIEKALRGQEQLPDSVARKAASRGRVKAFRVEAEVLVNNSWSNRYTVLEISGLDRPGLLYDLTRAISALNLNINSAHVATFGERAVDVFYVKADVATQRRIDIFGHVVLLIPSMLALAYWSWPSVRNSWKILEGPISVGGIEAVFLMKSLIPAFCVLLILQSLALLIRLYLPRTGGLPREDEA